MERYIDANLIPYVASENGTLDDYAYRYDINEIPTADVVPKADLDDWLTIVEGFQQMFEYSYERHQEELAKTRAEVAREIFAEIEVKIPFLCENQKAYEVFMMKLAELKKKYGVE